MSKPDWIPIDKSKLLNKQETFKKALDDPECQKALARAITLILSWPSKNKEE